METFHWENLKYRTPLFKLYCHQLGEGEATGFHRHDFYEIFWVLSGQVKHTVNGTSSILHPGSLVWIRSFDAHGLEYVPTCKRVNFYNLAVPKAIIDELLDRYPELKNYFIPLARQPIEIMLSSLQLEWLNNIAERMQKEGSRLELDRFLINLLAELQANKSNPYRNCPSWLAEACARLAQPEYLKLGSKAIAVIAGRSPEHVARELRKYAGITPSMAVNAARVDYAARLLTSSHASITDIAFMCGFGNVTCFFEKFRKTHRCTPMAFRRKYRLH